MRQLPRGVRNNNPGNIDFIPSNKWFGQIGIETGVPNPRFAKFDSPENGIRAIAKLLVGYHKRGFNTVRLMINRWAPPVENDTGAYVNSVAKRMGVEPDMKLAVTLFMLEIMATAIIEHENGYQPYTIDVIQAGVRRVNQ